MACFKPYCEIVDQLDNSQGQQSSLIWGITTLSITACSIRTLIIITLGMRTLSIMTLSIMTLSRVSTATLSITINKARHPA
jgi:hypothetical protein